MGKMKDLIYDTSDILVAIIIVLIASIIIAFSIGRIMDYPAKLAEQQSQENQNFGLAVPLGEEEEASGETEPPATEEESATTSEPATTAPESEFYAVPPTVTVVINSGESMPVIAQKMVDYGFFKSTQQFTTTVMNLQAESSIKAGTFIIPSDSTPEQVVKILSQ